MNQPLCAAAFEEETASYKAIQRQARKKEKARKQARRNPKPLVPQNKTQEFYIESLIKNELTFGIGPAGTGKTYVPARIFGDRLAKGEIEKIYVARPNVSKAKHRMGFLPGTMEDKTAPWLVPIFEGIRESMAPSEFDRLRREKRIEEIPYEFIQGRTLKNAACIIDEAENLDLDDLYITLTRQGTGLSMVLCGDPNQARIPDSGLMRVVAMAREPWMRGIGVIEFTENDVVRSAQAQQWVKAFNRSGLYVTAEYDMEQGTAEAHLPAFILRGT